MVEISLLTDTFLNWNVSFSGLDSCSQLMFSHGLLLYLSGKSFFFPERTHVLGGCEVPPWIGHLS